MREILFRGKRVDNSEWVEGSLVIDKVVDMCLIYPFKEYSPWVLSYVVLPSTVGQYTGLTDKNGKRIFEGDVVQGEAEEARGVIEWQQGEARYLVTVRNGYDWLFMDDDEWRVVGNIHDNPELLEG